MQACISKSQKGFTLIELMIVIAIIGLLSSIILASLTVALKKGRDARRISDLAEIQTALELYYSTANSYPSASSQATAATALSALVTAGDMASVPDDPLGGSYHYVYLSSNGSNGTAQYYCVGSILENTPYPTSGCNATSLGASLSGVQYSIGP
jgi:type II secretion system protein G